MAKRHNRDAFDKEVMAHIDALYNTALRLTRNEALAQDLVQDAYVKALRFWEGYEPGTNAKAWMFKIMMNLFYTGYARREHEREVMELRAFEPGNSLADADVNIPEHRDPESFLLDNIVSDDLREALEALPVDFRTVVVLADLEDFTYREIADVLDIPAGTVMSRLFRARQSLKKKLVHLAVERGIVQEDKVAHLDEYRRKAAGTES
jgi:RNA polymerase sigma-70 factor (ECF subfamily)